MSYTTISTAPWYWWCESGVCPEAAGAVHLEHGSVLSPANQRLLAGAYGPMADHIRCPAFPSTPVGADATLRPLTFDVMLAPSRGAIARRSAAVRAASALHELAHAKAIFDNTTPAAGGMSPNWLAAGEGKTHAMLQLMGRLVRTGLVRLLRQVDFERIVANAFGAELSSWGSPLEMLIEQFRDVLGLDRASSRNLRAVLLLLVGPRCLVFAGHRDRLEAVGSKGRVYLRTALTGASTRNAPPVGRVVRRSGTTGTRTLPPMRLAA
ncbi:hypothetical protein [Streptomyces sp. HC307]|uniref:hypothetical protein n=1 Tax=Streptomyces flavusporus TaxID=3385496 RepID=UPI0039174106